MKLGSVLGPLLVTGLLLAAGTARADDYEGPAVHARSGATFGASLGGGQMGCQNDQCDTLNGAGSLDLHVGGMLAPRLALVGDLWGMAHSDDRVTISQVLITAGLRYWPLRPLWLQGGVGIARSALDWDSSVVNVQTKSDVVPGLMAGVGVELVSTRSFAVDIALRAGTGFYEHDMRVYNLALGVGVDFY
jgi:hypothetical protein